MGNVLRLEASMTEKSGAVGAIVGVVLMGGAAWSAYSFLDQNIENRLPVEARRAIIKMQEKLPIEIASGVFLEKFDLSESYLDFTIRALYMDPNIRENSDKIHELGHGFKNFFCEWRDNYARDIDFDIKTTILNRDGEKIERLVNTYQDCRSIQSGFESRV